eukprot:TRINITY_DN765_c0_g1_i3.p2 TRINITY_DN765_c0_g1~~TRINITY_DN765_c0_g1_i3.p2  ORF type:complete len:377 (-),score=102.55 TRINITY_DN765_c0_g1_i3:2002-3132(-)
MSHKRDDPISLNEQQFIKQAIAEQMRIDGRGLYDFRSLKITFGDSFGKVQVQLGRTRILIVTSCEVVEPYPDRPTEGFFHFNINFSPMSSPIFDDSRPDEYGVELGRIIERGLRESRAIDTEGLCIVANEKVWSIRLDIHIIDHCGNLIDCCSIGTITALHHFRRPDLTIQGENVTIHSADDREPVPLSIHHMPICVTFGIFDEGNILVVDPNWKEEKLMSGRITYTLNIHKELCGIQKAGGDSLSMQHILDAAKIAQVKVYELTKAIKQAINNDLEKRGVEQMNAALMVTGIGTQESESGNVNFYDGYKSVSIKQEHIEEQIEIPKFTDTEKDFEEFATYLAQSKVTVVKEEEMKDASLDEMDIDDSEEETTTVL